MSLTTRWSPLERLPFMTGFTSILTRERRCSKKYAVFFDYDDAQGAFPVERVASDTVAITLISGPFHKHIAGGAQDLLHLGSPEAS